MVSCVADLNVHGALVTSLLYEPCDAPHGRPVQWAKTLCIVVPQGWWVGNAGKVLSDSKTVALCIPFLPCVPPCSFLSPVADVPCP